MIYAEYEFYITTYGGNQIQEADWTKTAREASAFIDQLTFGRLKNHPERVTEEVQMAVCAAAEVVGRYQTALTQHAAGIASESVGGQSVTYRNSTELVTGKQTEIGQAASLYLPLSHPLRYAGVCPC